MWTARFSIWRRRWTVSRQDDVARVPSGLIDLHFRSLLAALVGPAVRKGRAYPSGFVCSTCGSWFNGYVAHVGKVGLRVSLHIPCAVRWYRPLLFKNGTSPLECLLE